MNSRSNGPTKNALPQPVESSGKVRIKFGVMAEAIRELGLDYLKEQADRARRMMPGPYKEASKAADEAKRFHAQGLYVKAGQSYEAAARILELRMRRGEKFQKKYGEMRRGYLVAAVNEYRYAMDSSFDFSAERPRRQALEELPSETENWSPAIQRMQIRCYEFLGEKDMALMLANQSEENDRRMNREKEFALYLRIGEWKREILALVADKRVDGFNAKRKEALGVAAKMLVAAQRIPPSVSGVSGVNFIDRIKIWLDHVFGPAYAKELEPLIRRDSVSGGTGMRP